MTDQPIRPKAAAPLPALVKPQMTFKYVACRRYGCHPGKVIAKSAALLHFAACCLLTTMCVVWRTDNWLHNIVSYSVLE